MKRKTRLRVLCADDDVSVGGWIAATLRHHGYECETAVDGNQALYKLATDERGYELLITDARMPHLDGLGLILCARAGGFRGGVMVFSGSMEGEERCRYEALPVDAILAKPATENELLHCVKLVEQHP